MNDLCQYIVIEPPTMESLARAFLSFSSSPEITIKTKDAGTAVEIAKIARSLEEQGSENHVLSGSSDGWCFLKILFHPYKTWRI